ncbi:MAG: hypothetical protein RLZZ628_4291 [Bacteroidota bacterium]|jgi:hypothetical protein
MCVNFVDKWITFDFSRENLKVIHLLRFLFGKHVDNF